MAEHKNRILVIDDEKSLCDSLSAMLKDSGYEVMTAGDGKKGLELALKQQPNLILLDYKIPKLDGIEVLEQLRKDEWGKYAPVIVMTNLYDVTIINQIMQLGVKDYILKADISLDALLQHVGLYVPAPKAQTQG